MNQSIIDYYNSIKKNESGKDLQIFCEKAYLLSLTLRFALSFDLAQHLDHFWFFFLYFFGPFWSLWRLAQFVVSGELGRPFDVELLSVVECQ